MRILLPTLPEIIPGRERLGLPGSGSKAGGAGTEIGRISEPGAGALRSRALLPVPEGIRDRKESKPIHYITTRACAIPGL